MRQRHLSPSKKIRGERGRGLESSPCGWNAVGSTTAGFSPAWTWSRDTWWNAAGFIPEVAPWLAFLQPELGRETRGEMLQDLYLRLPPGWRFSSLNLAVRHMVKCCRIYTWGCPPAGVSPAWTWPRDMWWNAAGFHSSSLRIWSRTPGSSSATLCQKQRDHSGGRVVRNLCTVPDPDLLLLLALQVPDQEAIKLTKKIFSLFFFHLLHSL